MKPLSLKFVAWHVLIIFFPQTSAFVPHLRIILASSSAKIRDLSARILAQHLTTSERSSLLSLTLENAFKCANWMHGVLLLVRIQCTGSVLSHSLQISGKNHFLFFPGSLSIFYRRQRKDTVPKWPLSLKRHSLASRTYTGGHRTSAARIFRRKASTWHCTCIG